MKTPFTGIWITILAGCTMAGSATPLVFTSNQAAPSARELGYLACATALHRAYSNRYRLSLRQAYRSALNGDGRTRLFRLSGYVDEGGARTLAEFECVTDRTRRGRVLSLTRLSKYPFED